MHVDTVQSGQGPPASPISLQSFVPGRAVAGRTVGSVTLRIPGGEAQCSHCERPRGWPGVVRAQERVLRLCTDLTSRPHAPHCCGHHGVRPRGMHAQWGHTGQAQLQERALPGQPEVRHGLRGPGRPGAL